MYPERDGYAGTAPVGSFPEGASPYGALDMAGNVFEWTAEQVRSREGAPAYVIRGGAFNGFRPEFAAAALRFPQDPAAHTHGIGFRCVSPPVSR
jgi:formylglycine-generating enzyme required for sulfatase activity